MTTDRWKGGSGNWTDPGDWSLGKVPGATNTVLINVANSFVTLSSATTVGALTISSTSATLDIKAASGHDVVTGTVANKGTVEIHDSVGLKVGGRFTNNGTLDLDTAYYDGDSALTIVGTLVNTDLVQIGNAYLGAPETVTLGGLSNAANATFNVQGASGHDVTIAFSAGGAGFLSNAGTFGLDYVSALTFTKNFKNSGAFTLQNVASLTVNGSFANSADVEVHDDTKLTVKGGLTNSGTLNFDNAYYEGGGALAVTGTLSNTNSVEIGNAYLSGSEIVTLGGLTNASGATFGVSGATLQASVTGSTVNNGVIVVEGGATLDLDGPVTGSGVVQINTGTLAVMSAFSENVAFNSSGGELELAHSVDYSGAISGFSLYGKSTLDLLDINFIKGATKATFKENGQQTGGVLTVTDKTHTAHITLMGKYAGSTFTVSSDGHGGVTVVNSSNEVANAPPGPAPSAFAGAMAGFGVRAAGIGYQTFEPMGSLRGFLAHPVA